MPDKEGQKISIKSTLKKNELRFKEKVKIFPILVMIYMLFAMNDRFCSIHHHISTA
jgi:hypothetical protein